jgi:acylphosphatase
MTRVSVIVHGRVQGVAFRHYTCQRALELGVTGWVRNLPDGEVEGLFEGNNRGGGPGGMVSQRAAYGAGGSAGSPRRALHRRIRRILHNLSN